jgi:hypothetical protein
MIERRQTPPRLFATRTSAHARHEDTQIVTQSHAAEKRIAAEGPKTLVGVAGFEPTASSSRTKRATKLRHTPWQPAQHTEDVEVD